MRTVYIVTAKAKASAVAEVRKTHPELADVMAANPLSQRYFTKRSADRCETEWLASGIWDVTRSTGLAGSLEDVFMHVTGLCPAQVAS